MGWRVVTEYETNPFASDSEDEKRMYRAEVRASKKAKMDKSKRRPLAAPYKRPFPSDDRRSGMESNHVQSTFGRKPGLCFVCGMGGHWKNVSSGSF